ncbi:MAG: DUF4956 domain-containing protein [Gammaproteobacteria bacterium]|nr:MAG: DUF4956 domain-containing protein [Gammaproteobacteria bacterium]
MLNELGFPQGAPLALMPLLLNLVIGAGMSLVLRWHFRQFGSTLSNREEFAQVFPFVLLTTLLIISIVKSSLALSLGLVGALSIVRFRTPIKEPEELAYLFIAIAIGLGLGASQTVNTVVAGLFILLIMALFKRQRKDLGDKNLYLSIDWKVGADDEPDKFITQVNAIMAKHVISSDLRRFDIREGLLESTYFVDIASADNLSVLISELRADYPDIGLTFLDQNQLPGV